MLGIIKTVNGQKKVIPLTADAGAGNPVGTIIVVCSNQIPSNYLPLGTQYDTTLYPVLYALLGTDTTPTASALGLPTLTSGQYAIKATSGLSENAQDNVVAQLNEERSYSTEEINTGAKWIDGKPIYRKVVNIGNLPNNVSKTVAHNIQNIEIAIKAEVIAKNSNNNILLTATYGGTACTCFVNNTNIQVGTNQDMTSYSGYVILEYTKTTD